MSTRQPTRTAAAPAGTSTGRRAAASSSRRPCARSASTAPGVGMDEIAAVAGTSKTVVYRHFTDRAGPVCRGRRERRRAASCATSRRPLGAAGRRPAAASTPRRATSSPRAIDAYLGLVEKDPEVYRFIVDAPLLDAAVRRPRGAGDRPHRRADVAGPRRGPGASPAATPPPLPSGAPGSSAWSAPPRTSGWPTPARLSRTAAHRPPHRPRLGRPVRPPGPSRRPDPRTPTQETHDRPRHRPAPQPRRALGRTSATRPGPTSSPSGSPRPPRS